MPLASYTLIFSRIAVGFVFALSSFAKLRDYLAYEQAVGNFRILPENGENHCLSCRIELSWV